MGDIRHEDTVCTVGVTNFWARINPAGMALMLSIDPTAIFIPRYEHTAWGASLMHHANVTLDTLYHLEGFCRLYRYIVNDIQTDILSDSGRMFLMDGFPYEIDVKEGSPLVGWLNVLQGVSDGR